MRAMRFEVASAFVLGAAIPILETLRRGLGFENVTTLVEDWLIGAILLAAAASVRAGRRHGPVFLVVAWAMLAGGLFPSLFWHLEAMLRGDVTGSREAITVGVKAVLYVICLVALVRSARALASVATPRDEGLA